MDSAQLKRQIIDQSEISGIRKNLIQNKDSGITQDDIIEMGIAMEQTVNTKGWSYIEAYLLKKCDPTLILFGDSSPDIKGEARGAVNVMHYIDQTIKAKNELLRKANEGQTTDNTQ